LRHPLSGVDFQSAVSQGFQPASPKNSPVFETVQRPADWPPSRRSGAMARREGGKSATQQIGNLRYCAADTR